MFSYILKPPGLFLGGFFVFMETLSELNCLVYYYSEFNQINSNVFFDILVPIRKVGRVVDRGGLENR